LSDKYSDSAGVPWEGRSFEQNAFADDDGKTPKALGAALADHPIDKSALVAALTDSRLLIPLIATLGESEQGPHGQLVDKSAELAIVAVATPDKQTAIPVFSSVADMAKWKSDARPVPASAQRVALAAASEGHSRIILNPATDAVALRTPALEAIAKREQWFPPHKDPWVLSWCEEVAMRHPLISTIDLFDGDPKLDLSHAELLIQLGMRPSVSPDKLKELLTSFTDELRSEEFNRRVDSIGYRLVVA